MAADSKIRATVTAVDLKRSLCKCVTPTGNCIRDVRWLSLQSGSGAASDGYHPQEFDTVFIERINGTPYIVGSEHVAYYKVVNTRHLRVQEETPEDVADYSTMSFNKIQFSPGRVEDQRVGDKIQTVDSGSLFGMRRSGTFIAKVNSLCQFMLSPFGDLARLVARNLEVFTDVDAQYKVNSRGKLYTFRQIFRNMADSRATRVSLLEVEGDVAQGEAIGAGYAQMKKDGHQSASSGANAADELVVRRSRVYDASDINTRTESLSVDGKHDVIITDDGGNHTNHTVKTNAIEEQEIHDASTNSDHTRHVDASKRHESFIGSGGSHKAESHTEGGRHWIRIYQGDGSYFELTEATAHIDVGGVSTLDIDKNKIVINTSGSAVTTLNKDGTVVIKGTTSTTIDSPITNVKGILNVDGVTNLKSALNVTGFSQLTGGLNVG